MRRLKCQVSKKYDCTRLGIFQTYIHEVNIIWLPLARTVCDVGVHLNPLRGKLVLECGNSPKTFGTNRLLTMYRVLKLVCHFLFSIPNICVKADLRKLSAGYANDMKTPFSCEP